MNRFILPLFWATLGVFIILMVTMFAPLRLPMGFVPFLFPSVQALFFILGLALLILSIRAKLDRMLKKFLILTGASAVGMAGSQFLHNLVFGLFIQLFGGELLGQNRHRGRAGLLYAGRLYLPDCLSGGGSGQHCAHGEKTLSLNKSRT